jgi:hypothetical protein
MHRHQLAIDQLSKQGGHLLQYMGYSSSPPFNEKLSQALDFGSRPMRVWSQKTGLRWVLTSKKRGKL